MKRIVKLLIAFAFLCSILTACGKAKQITSTKAERIALKDMGAVASLSQVHTHAFNEENGVFYNVYITYGNQNMTYLIDNEGNIVTKTEGSHSH